MPLFTQLAKLIYFLPCAILSIVILDLIRNRSLVTQYLHWTVYVLVGTTGAIFTGQCLAVSRATKPRREALPSWISQLILSSIKSPPQSRHHISSLENTTIEYEVKNLTLILVQKYIEPWSQELQPNLSHDIGQEIQAFLLLLSQKLDNLEGIVVLTEALTLLRLHLRKTQKPRKGTVPREKHVETALKQLFLAWGLQYKLTSDLIFIVVNKILTSQVILRFIDYASSPETIDAYITTFFLGEEVTEASDLLAEPFTSNVSDLENSSALLSCNMFQKKTMQNDEGMSEDTKECSKKTETKEAEASGFIQAPSMPKAASGCKDMVMEPKESALDAGSKISNALGNLFCGTAGPLLPSNTAFQSFNNLWRSPSTESLDLPMETSTQDYGKRSLQSKLRRLSFQHEPLIYNPFRTSVKKRMKSNSLDLGKEPKNVFTMKTQTFDFIHDSEEEEDSLNYEDNEDLESTISKLRQLLADKDSASSSTEASTIRIEYVNSDDGFIVKIEESGILIKKKLLDFLELKSKIDPDGKTWEHEELNGQDIAQVLEKWAQDPMMASTVEMKAFLEPSEEKKRKGLAKKMTGMLNSIKDVFPTFEDEPHQHHESSDSTSHFLLPPIFTPNSSPSKETFELPNNSSSKPKKLAFNFVSNTNEKSELEATLDFHVQHWKNLPTEGGGVDTVDYFGPELQTFKDDVISDSPDGHQANLAALTIQMMMVDIPKFLFNGQDCLDNAILYNFALATLGDLLQKHLEESLAQDWIHMGLQKISNILRPPPQAQDSDCNASFVISEEAKNPLKTLLQLFGCSWEEMVEKLKSLTIDQKANEDFLLDLFDLIVTKLLVKESI